ncbi:helix-turn-helix domain-containing protein [Flavobacteriaceae bacterium F89]|uniref:Helix-turn-helix domain-containing protein n=1 Tax=Cerina litoralis TaxID=2874477 RepID=A0AAE3ESX0_9FLAO|nr:helix-turn-helix domain-containing protein [Cerina litoralis]MCG2460388.1 helix-turn-helix domain-containing protein [Cerina litoralis]
MSDLTNFTHDTLPQGVTMLFKEFNELKRLLLKKQAEPTEQADKWLGLDDLVKYDPAKRAKATWYSIVSRGKVPYHKNGKHLVFLQSEIDEWLRTGKRRSNAEIEAEAEAYLSNDKKGLK